MTKQATTDPNLLVIVGNARSGTTYLQEVLYRSLGIAYGPEPKFIVPYLRKIDRFGDLEQERNLRRLVEAICREPYFEYVAKWHKFQLTPDDILSVVREPTYKGVILAIFQAFANKRNMTRLGYKDPSDIWHISEIAKLLPSARFIHILRDGRDVAISLLKFIWGHTNLYAGSRDWARGARKGIDEGRALGSHYFEMRYEDLILKPEEVVPSLASFIEGGDSPETSAAILEDILQTSNTNALYGWKHRLDRQQRYLCEAAAKPVLEACGYETEFDNPHISLSKAAYYLFGDYIHMSANHAYRRITRWRLE
jgi:hypothetical protein